ncbi:hypothetical protein [Acinetobacter sp.]|uniref:hypothetical protein n=1 Tax=Acinetobacter sp. TaxID=472 RepID=UPI0037515386
MADSLVIDWLNENALRAYPLKEMITRVSDDYTLDDGVILDAQFVYANLLSDVALTQIVSNTTDVIFTLTGGVVFTISKSGVFPAYARTSQGHLLVVGASAANIPIGTYIFSNVIFESSVSFEFGEAWLGVQSLNFNSSSPIIGDINFIEGYQFGIHVTRSVITLNCGAGYGRPLSCISFGGVSDCTAIVSYVNGVGPDGHKVLHFKSGGGIVIFDDPPNHRIFIGLASDPNKDTCKTITSNPAL